MATATATQDRAPMMDINTTPLIDVMLVLLIMFIITLPPPTHVVRIDTPPPSHIDLPPPDSVKNKVAIAADGTVSWNGAAVDLVTLRTLLDRTVRMLPEPELQVQPDADAQYARVDQTLAVIKRAGVGKLGIVGNERYSDDF